MSDEETLSVYAAKAQDYADLTQAALAVDPLLASFITALPKGAQVLDLGCGPGTAAHVMADAGLIVTATDAVPEMIEMARSHPKVTTRVERFDQITGTGIYDGIWANFSLLHAPRNDLPGHLGALKQALRAGGLLHIALKTGTGEKRDSIGRYYSYYTDEELTAHLETAGFRVKDRFTGCDKGMNGTMDNWIAIRADA